MIRQPRSKIGRIPPEFGEFISNLQKQLIEQTGEDYPQSRVLRKMGNKLKNKIVVRNGEFTWELL